MARERVRQVEYELSCGDLYQISRTPVPEFLEEFCGHLRATRTAKSCYNVFNRLRSVFGPVCPSLRARQPGSPARRL